MKRIIIFLLLFIFLILFVFNFSHIIPNRLAIRDQVKNFLPPKIYSFISVLTSSELSTKRLNNDFNEFFLPFTQQQNFEVGEIKLDFIKDNISGYLNKKKTKTFYIENYGDNFLVATKTGEFFISKNLKINKSSFTKISSNLDEFKILDIYIDGDYLYVSGFKENKLCKKLSLYKTTLKKSFDFIEIFENNECADKIMAGRIQSYIENNNKYILLATAADILKDRITEKDSKPQDDNSIYGKIIKIDANTLKYDLFTKGHRNILGLYVDEDVILATENGPKGGDEINKIEQGKNYGWDISSYGLKYKSQKPYSSHKENNFQEPIYTFIPSVGISEIIKINGEGFNSSWRNNFLIGSLNYNHLLRVKFDNDFKKVIFVEKIYIGSRIRDLTYIQEINSIILSSEEGKLIVLKPLQ
jgi:hypothetical protein